MNLRVGNKYYNLFFTTDFFFRKCQSNAQIWIIRFCLLLVFSSKNGVPLKNSQLHSLISQSHKHFSSIQTSSLSLHQKCFQSPCPFVTQNIEKHIYSGLRESTIINFSVSTRIILWICFFFFLKTILWQWRTLWQLLLLWATTLICTKEPSFFIHHCFYTTITYVNIVEKVNNLLVLQKEFWDCGHLDKSLLDYQPWVDHTLRTSLVKKDV